jgi:hypothetical protein
MYLIIESMSEYRNRIELLLLPASKAAVTAYYRPVGKAAHWEGGYIYLLYWYFQQDISV